MSFVLQLYGLRLCILLAVTGNSTAFAQQVQPIPVVPTPLISSQASTACLVGCDTQVMTCQNACMVVGPTASSNPAGTAPCALNCTTQQLVCKQACSRSQP
jgi:hypothetical protein